MEKSVNVLDKLASALGQRDEAPNIALAEAIATTEDQEAIAALVGGLQQKKATANDCIKVLYEIGERKPALIVDYLEDFKALLFHKNNRLQWGAMTALYWISKAKPDKVYAHLVQIMEAADKGSVITRDYAINILIELASCAPYANDAQDLLLEQFRQSPVNQLPMYAERALPIITEAYRTRFAEVLIQRLNDVEKASKRKRLEKVLKHLNN
ncbi:MAG TPA: hypothetical protein DCS93_31225 [Microscillaceae bacterium]|nr:hypothetical protein [Microscillaceae bacterium]